MDTCNVGSTFGQKIHSYEKYKTFNFSIKYYCGIRMVSSKKALQKENRLLTIIDDDYFVKLFDRFERILFSHEYDTLCFRKNIICMNNNWNVIMTL